MSECPNLLRHNRVRVTCERHQNQSVLHCQDFHLYLKAHITSPSIERLNPSREHVIIHSDHEISFRVFPYHPFGGVILLC